MLSVLNNGTIKELKKLQGVGEKRARLIVDWRTIHGPFQQVNNRINEPNNNFARASRFLVHFFAFNAQLRREMTKF